MSQWKKWPQLKEADRKKVKDKWEPKFKPCEELGKNKSKEEQDKMLEEFKKCK